jgi:hypothetical protein
MLLLNMAKGGFKNFFIIGCNRSGTSLLRTMLNHHSEVAVPLESIFLVDYLKNANRIGIEKQKKYLVREPMLDEWGIKLDPERLAKVEDTAGIVRLVHEEYARKHGKKYWGNKTPRLTHYGELIKANLPEACFIHLIRDPRAVSLSLANSMIHRSNIYFGARRWVRHVRAALKLEKRYSKDVLRVYYEDLVKDPEKELRKICKFLKIKYQKAMLEYQETANREYRKYHKGAHKNLASLPLTKQIDVWRKRLSKREMRIIEHICGDLMIEVGYQPILKETSLKEMEIYYYRAHRVWGFSLQVIRYIIYCPWYLGYTLWRRLMFGTFIDEIKGINY